MSGRFNRYFGHHLAGILFAAAAGARTVGENEAGGDRVGPDAVSVVVYGEGASELEQCGIGRAVGGALGTPSWPEIRVRM